MRVMVSLTRAAAITLISLLAITPSFAQTDAESKEQNHERTYQVEIIVFGRSEANPQEQWPTDIKLSYPNNAMAIKSDSNTGDSFTALPPNERLLNPQAATIAKSGSYTLLYHQAWRQKIYGKKTHILISGGKSFNGHQELEGSISLSVAQYLKVQTNLWLTQFEPEGSPIVEVWPELPPIPNSDVSDADKSQHYLIKRIVKVSQTRSMRSHEVHYIDHPLMGIIMKIIPIDVPNNKSN